MSALTSRSADIELVLRAGRNADADAKPALMPLVGSGSPHLPDDAVGKQSQAGRRLPPWPTTTNSSPPMRADEIRVPDIRLEDLRGMHEHRVAGRMAERVVDLLEPVEVDMQQRDLAAVAARACRVLLQDLVEIAAVRQAGQRIVKRIMLDARLGRLQFGSSSIPTAAARAPDPCSAATSLGHVPFGADHLGRAAVVLEERRAGAQMTKLAVSDGRAGSAE